MRCQGITAQPHAEAGRDRAVSRACTAAGIEADCDTLQPGGTWPSLRILVWMRLKIASPDAVNLPLIEAVAGLGKPMLISTGTCTLDELAPRSGPAPSSTRPADACCNACRATRHRPAMRRLEESRPSTSGSAWRVGYSDHTQRDNNRCVGGIAAGACLCLKKHLTYDPRGRRT